MEAFDSRWLLVAPFFRWSPGHASTQQRHGCTPLMSLRELSCIHAHDVSDVMICQGPDDACAFRNQFAGFHPLWYAASRNPLDALLVGGRANSAHLA